MKSNASATATRATIVPNPMPTVSTGGASGSTVFEDDALDQVGDVFAFGRHRLEQLIDLPQLDDLLCVRLLAEQLRHRRAHDVIGVGLEPVDLGAQLEDRVSIVHGVKLGDRVAHFLRTGDAYFGQALRFGRHRANIVEKQALRDVLHEIEHVVHGRDQLMDLVAVERRDERLMEELHRVMRDLVGLFFMPLDVPAPRLEAAQIAKQCLELHGREHRAARVLIEIIEEPALPRQQTHHPRPCRSIDARLSHRRRASPKPCKVPGPRGDENTRRHANGAMLRLISSDRMLRWNPRLRLERPLYSAAAASGASKPCSTACVACTRSSPATRADAQPTRPTKTYA